MKHLLLALLCGIGLAQSPVPAAHSSNWVNVLDYGAKGDGGDDTAAFLAAINAVASGKSQGNPAGGTVYCPLGTNNYYFPHGITLPSLNNIWVELYLDCNIGLGGPLVIQGSGYYIHGHNSGPANNFGTQGTSQIYAIEGVNPAIQISTYGTRLENLSVSTGNGDAIQILGNNAFGINASSMVSLIEVHSVVRDPNATGSPLHIIGGFGYYIEGGGYESQNQPTILIETPSPACLGMGIVTMERVYLGNHGIQLKAPCGFIGNVKMRATLYESGKDALVNLRGPWPGIINSVNLEDCAIADSNVEAVNNQASRVYGVKIDNCPVTGGVLTTGNPIGMLTIWYPAEPENPAILGVFAGLPIPTVPSIAQTRGYELHFGDRIINTIPVLNLDKFDVQKGFVQQANPPD